MPETIPRNRREWTLQTVQAVQSLAGDSEGREATALYRRGDHWHDGKNWMGAGRDAAGNLPPETAAQIKLLMVPAPEIEDGIGGRVDAVCATEADYSLAPLNPKVDENGKTILSAGQEREIAEWKSVTGDWWGTKQVWEKVRAAVADATADVGCWRLFFNPLAVREDERTGRNGIPLQTDPAKAAELVEIVAPSPGTCAVYTDPDTQQKTAVYSYTTQDGQQAAEVWFVDDDESRTTILRRIIGADSQEWSYAWGGLLPIIQCDITRLVGQVQRDLQRGVDFAGASLMRNTEAHGFTQRTETNARPHGYWSTAAPSGIPLELVEKREEGSTTYYFNPQDPNIGPGTTVRLIGVEHTVSIDPETGKETRGITTPTVEYHEPSSPENILLTRRELKQEIRSSMRRGHVVDGTSAEASGDAYEQRRAVHILDVKTCAGKIAVHVAQILTAMTVMREWLAGVNDARFLREWTASASLRPNTGPISSERERTLRESVDAGHLSLPTAMEERGINDVDVEFERMQEHPAPAMRTKAFTDAQILRDAGGNPEAAYRIAGVPEDDAADLVRSDTIPPEQ